MISTEWIVQLAVAKEHNVHLLLSFCLFLSLRSNLECDGGEVDKVEEMRRLLLVERPLFNVLSVKVIPHRSL